MSTLDRVNLIFGHSGYFILRIYPAMSPEMKHSGCQQLNITQKILRENQAVLAMRHYQSFHLHFTIFSKPSY